MSIQEILVKKDVDFSLISDTESERESDGTRRKLYNDDTETIKVFLRVRGYTDEEAKFQLPTINLKTENANTLVVYPPDVGLSKGAIVHKFHFSGIYDSSVGQQQLYEDALHDIVKEFVGGTNFLAFNYGVTNAGKTFTMQGTPMQPGLVPRALDNIFALLQGKISPKIGVKPHNGGVIKLGPADVSAELRFKDDLLNRDCDSMAASIFMDTLNASTMKREMSLNFSSASSIASDAFSTKTSSFGSFNFTRDSLNSDSGTSYSIWVSFVEVYNELIFDLLETIKGAKRTSLKLCERGNGNVFIKGAKEVCVFTAEEAYKVLLAGQKNLRYAATKLNHNSSRSHCLFTIKLLTFRECGTATITQLSFCDLAGSERAAKTQSQGDRLREAGLINTSLLVLGRCFEILRANQKLGKDNSLPVPFRESKLTRILQNNFSGKARALMMVNISPCSNMYNETMHVLKFSAIASEVLLSQNSDVLLQDFQHARTSLALLRRSLGVRESLPWESSSVEGVSGDRASNRTTAIFENEGDEEWETDEEEEENYKKKVYDLYELAQKLSDRLQKERADKLQMEIDIREELTEEFQARINQLHDFYQDQMDQVYDDAEDMADKRIEIHDEFYRNSKRVRPNTDEPRESGVAVEARTENDSRVAELESEVRVGQEENETLKENLRKALESEVSKQEQLTALHFQMAEVRREADFHNYEKQIEALKQELASAKSELESQRKLVAQAETQQKLRTQHVEALLRDFEKIQRAMLLLNEVDIKPNVDVLPVAVDEEARRQELNRRSIYYSMSSSSGPSTTETPKSAQIESRKAAAVEAPSSGDDEICKSLADSLVLNESPEMPKLSPKNTAAVVPNEVFEMSELSPQNTAAVIPNEVFEMSELSPQKTAAVVPNEVFEGEDDEDAVDSVPETPEAKIAKAAVVFVDSSTSPVFTLEEKLKNEAFLSRIEELEKVARDAYNHVQLKKETSTPHLQKEDIENQLPKTGRKKTAKKEKTKRTTRLPLPQEESSIDEMMSSASSLKKKSKMPMPKKQPEKERFLCSPVQEPLAADSPDVQTQVLRKLRRRK